MPFVRSIDNAKPPKRFDAIPFTQALFQEAAVLAGPWSTVETINLSPVDPDPANPLERDLTTDSALLASGYYRIQWKDAGSATFDGPAVFFGGGSTLASVEDVCRVLRTSVPEDTSAIDAALQVADSWVRLHTKQPNIGATASYTVDHTDVHRSGYVRAQGPVEEVSVVEAPGANARVLGAAEWDFDGTWVRFRVSDEAWYDPRFGPSDLHSPYVKVSVRSGAAGVDPIVRDAVALTAAALWTRGPRLAKGLSGETIGDYSYSVASLELGDPWFEQAKALLRPIVASGPLVV